MEINFEARDLRTDVYSGVSDRYKSVRIHVIVTADIKEFRYQVMATNLLNILARWCRNIRVTCINDANILPNCSPQTSLHDSFSKLVTSIYPPINFFIDQEFGKVHEDYDIAVFIGKPTSIVTMPYVSIDAIGWVASCAFGLYGKCESSINNDENFTGSFFAVCLANAELFRWANGITSTSYVKWYDMAELKISQNEIINVKQFPSHIDFGKFQIVGCGAIGSSFTYLLGLTNWTGHVQFIDYDEVEIHNTSSSLLFTFNDVRAGTKKTDACKIYLGGNKNITTDSFDDAYSQFDYDHKNKQKSADVIFCFANEKNIWCSIQDIYPPVVFHASTSKNWGINVGRHIPIIDSCIVCTFKDFIDSVYTPMCHEGYMPKIESINENTSNTAILPFVSPTAALMVLNEFLKMYLEENIGINSVEFNMRGSGGRFITNFDNPKKCFSCSNQDNELYTDLNSASKYHSMSFKK